MTVTQKQQRIVRLSPESGGAVFRCRVMGTRGNLIAVSAPYEGSRAVWPAQGSKIRLYPNEQAYNAQHGGFHCTVVQRRVKPVPLLILTGSREALAAVRAAPLPSRHCRVITVTSGKGGAGKTTLTVNLAVELARSHRVVVVDADLGTADVAVSLGIKARHGLWDLLSGQIDLDRAVVAGPAGVDVLPGGSGVAGLANLNEWQFGRLLSAFEGLEREYDYIFFDTGAGISRAVLNFLMVADQAVLVTNCEPPAILDAYALIKALAAEERQPGLGVVINRAPCARDAAEAYERIAGAAQRFLHQRPPSLGWIREDSAVSKSVRGRYALNQRYPQAPAARAITDIAATLAGAAPPSASPAAGGFLDRLRSVLGIGG